MDGFSEILVLLVEIQVFTVSGALAPGPLSMATLGSGLRRGWKAGVYAATGHMVAELPIFFLVAIGILSAQAIINVRWILLLVGGFFLLYLSIQHMKISDVTFEAKDEARHPFLIGLVFSIFNPYFILWWIMIGSIFIVDTIRILGFSFLPIIYLTHVWMDYFWLTLLAFIAGEGVRRFGGSVIKYINIVLGIVLLSFALMFIYDALSAFIIS